MLVDETRRIMDEISDERALLVGRAVIEAAHLEKEIEFAIWSLFGYSVPWSELGHAITAPMRTSGKLTLLKTIASVKMGAGHNRRLSELVGDIRVYYNKRDALVHAQWIVKSSGITGRKWISGFEVKANEKISTRTREMEFEEVASMPDEAHALIARLLSLIDEWSRQDPAEPPSSPGTS